MMEMVGQRIRVRGLVQGVGFRPYVWQLANDAGLPGTVLNDGAGVDIEIWGKADDLANFRHRLEAEAPPLARIDSIEVSGIAGQPPQVPFRITQSVKGNVATGIVPDAAVCPACLDEIANPVGRRYRYAFTNCTHCGPRLSIMEGIPYDRSSTSMSAFAMCAACQAEYDNPTDRRFHAQPNACPDCGPRVWLENAAGKVQAGDPIAEAARLIGDGCIVAIKGIGGFHLACDATSDDAVSRLRQRKRRDRKPFAVMVRNLEDAEAWANVGSEEAEMLSAAVAPIVLVAAADGKLASEIAPGHDHIGVMLPYTPLHHLLMQALDGPIVLTSGNLSDEPQVTGNQQARAQLGGIVDYWLMHDRDIVNRLDDSVMRLDPTGPTVIRRARGLAPDPLPLSGALENGRRVLAMGGELKSTFCLTMAGQAVLSQHLGDLEHAATLDEFRNTIELYRRVFDFTPDTVAVDLHPDYLSTQFGQVLGQELAVDVIGVQHHHAHLASCLAEHQVPVGDERSLGVILDGLGLGEDGTIWGGEFLVGGYADFQRAGHFQPVALPGGAQAIREPWRNAYAHLKTAFGRDWLQALAATQIGEFLCNKPVATLDRMLERQINAPVSTSAGRLFDAAAAVIGVCVERQTYEGQAAMELEALARPHMSAERGYAADISCEPCMRIDWASMWEGLVADVRKGIDPGKIAARFHIGLCDVVAQVATSIAGREGICRVVLSGGVMQNRLLLAGLHHRLCNHNLEVLVHHRVPANDGGLALGQAVIAAVCDVGHSELQDGV